MLYIEQGDDARAAAGDHIARLAEDPDIGLTTITAGLLDLSMFLLFNLAKALGRDGGDGEMAQAAREILQVISMEQFPNAA